MADEYQHQTGVCSGNWWEQSKNRFESGSPSPSSSSSLTQLNNSMGSFGWPLADPHQHQHMLDDMKSTTRSVDSSAAAVTVTSATIFSDTQKLQGPDSPQVITDPNLQIMGLGLSCSQSLDWNNNQSLMGASMLQEDINRQPPSGGLGFSLDHHHHHHQFDAHSNSGESNPASNSIMQGLFGSDHPQQQHQASGYQPFLENYGMNCSSDHVLPNSWTQTPNKFPQQFLQADVSQPKQPHQLLHFSNNAPYWNAAVGGRPAFYPSTQVQVPSGRFDDKPKITTEKARESGTGGKKAGSDTAGAKRSRNETPASMPAFKVRKEKMGDRITALQQLVSPFGKTDTASVLSEAIEYIKFLHQQVSVLSTPYMNNTGAHPIQHQQVSSSEKLRDPDGPNLRSRGLCLVPVSSTFPVTHETTVDFWTPTFGGTFR